MFPEMLGEPGSACRPEAVVGVIDGGRAAPDVGVVVENPAIRAIVLPGGNLPASSSSPC